MTFDDIKAWVSKRPTLADALGMELVAFTADYLEARMPVDGRTHLAGDRFTLADVSVGYGLLLANLFGLGGAITGELKAYDERLKAMPSYKRAHGKA